MIRKAYVNVTVEIELANSESLKTVQRREAAIIEAAASGAFDGARKALFATPIPVRRVSTGTVEVVDQVSTVVAAAEPREPGLPLRQFIRGFLRDHLGFSKIMAHVAADVFMDRWLERKPETERRYAREDQHTMAATFDRHTVEEMDKMAGITKADKVAHFRDKLRQHSHQQECTCPPSATPGVPRTGT